MLRPLTYFGSCCLFAHLDLRGFFFLFLSLLIFFFLLERGWREGEGESGGQSRGPTSCWAQGSGSGRRRAWLRPPGLAALGDGPWSPALASRPGLLPLPSPSPAHSLPREQLQRDLRRPGDSRPPPSLPRLPAHTALLGLFVFFFFSIFFFLSLSLSFAFFFSSFFFYQRVTPFAELRRCDLLAARRRQSPLAAAAAAGGQCAGTGQRSPPPPGPRGRVPEAGCGGKRARPPGGRRRRELGAGGRFNKQKSVTVLAWKDPAESWAWWAPSSCNFFFLSYFLPRSPLPGRGAWGGRGCACAWAGGRECGRARRSGAPAGGGRGRGRGGDGGGGRAAEPGRLRESSGARASPAAGRPLAPGVLPAAARRLLGCPRLVLPLLAGRLGPCAAQRPRPGPPRLPRHARRGDRRPARAAAEEGRAAGEAAARSRGQPGRGLRVLGPARGRKPPRRSHRARPAGRWGSTPSLQGAAGA